MTVNQFPFWEKVKVEDAVDQFQTRIQKLLDIAGSKQVIISETGWPSGGENKNGSVASPESSAVS